MAKKGNNIYHRSDGRWEGRFYCRGTHKYKSVYGKSYTEAKEKLDKLRAEVLVPSKKCRLTFCDVVKLWLESRRTRIKGSSYASYRNKLDRQIIPFFGEMKYDKVDMGIIEEFIADKMNDGMSAKYVTDIVVMLKSTAKWAEKAHNYADRIRNAELPKAKPKETSVFSKEEQKKLISTIDSEKTSTGCGVLLTMFTGLRIGELCALKWEDIDLKGKVLHITKTLQRLTVFDKEKKSEIKITSPKSKTSIRDIPLPDFLIKMLSVYKHDSEDYVVSGSRKVTEPRCFTNRYKTLLKKANVPSRKFHAIRHTFATNALQQNFDIKTLSELLGHANANVTLSVYVHSSMERKSACMNRLQALV